MSENVVENILLRGTVNFERGTKITGLNKRHVGLI